MFDTGSMDGTASQEKLRKAGGTSLCFLSALYTECANGDLVFKGTRPGPEWKGHGYFWRWLWVIREGHRERKRLWKHRWKHKADGRTCHSRPPDELGRVSVCELIFVLVMFGFLSGRSGLHEQEPIFEGFELFPSTRTKQRWLHRALPNAMRAQQAYRLAVIERCEPRPVESLFPRGLSPPDWARRHWQAPSLVASLWRALALILDAAVKLAIPAALLLAEAHGREDISENPLLI
jgi:hypothetical protein